ncbi:histidine kinase dimerization/phosphoacceptor domain-containing protein, partial [Actinomyces sp. MRS3W]|uniref:histidine kinase dimerization/phosphoacceptor domain-containing protein n=1 Tax=Actinomyces sp. MRS3W TaxID=2800796 RepID=UPI0028FDC2B0
MTPSRPQPSSARRHSTAGRVVSGCLLVLLLSSLVAIGAGSPAPAVIVATRVILVLLVAIAWWLRLRDRHSFEASLAREAAARAVAEDRLALARDLHDLVSGALGAITVRAAVAQRLEREPEALLAALGEVEQTSREATAGLRRMLHALRDD